MSERLSETIAIRLNEDADSKLRKWADKGRQRLSDFVRELIIRGLKEKGKTDDQIQVFWPKNFEALREEEDDE